MFSLNSAKGRNIILKRFLGSNHYLLCERQRLYHSATETQLTEDTVKLILIYASVDSLNSLNSVPFRENSIVIIHEFKTVPVKEG